MGLIFFVIGYNLNFFQFFFKSLDHLIALFIFAMPIWDVVNQFYSNAQLSSAVSHMPLTKFLVDNFAIVLLGIVILSGVIMYAKIKLGGQNASSY